VAGSKKWIKPPADGSDEEDFAEATTAKDMPGGYMGPQNSGIQYTPKEPQPWLKPEEQQKILQQMKLSNADRLYGKKMVARG
jgi:hypothetical protein